MSNIDIDNVLAQLQVALGENDLNTARQILESLRKTDKADVFTELPDEEQIALLPELDPAVSADILEELDEEDAAELVTALPTNTAIRIVDEMEPDEAADLLGDIASDQASVILEALDNPEEIRPLLLHPDETAGGLMTSEFLALHRKMTAREAIEALRRWQPDTETIYYLFVVDSERKLVGVVSLRKLIVVEPQTLVEEIMETDVISVPAGADQEECARLMTRYDLLALPVMDERNTLIGVITIDDVMEVIEEEATEDIQRFGGAEPLEQPYLNTSFLTITRKRIGWLLLLFVTASLTGTVIRLFEEQLQKAVALTVFIPMLIGTGGNAGSQTTSTIIRALAVGDIDLEDAAKAWWHEFGVGFTLGIGMAVAGFIRAALWGADSSLAFTVSCSILAIIIWANSLGAVLPIVAAQLKIDPTVVSGPVMSTLVDATGLFIYFSIARVMMGL